jgi:hypothetical protein
LLLQPTRWSARLSATLEGTRRAEMRALAIIAFVMPLTVLAADCPKENKLREFVAQDPTLLAAAAISREDLKFLGFAGFTIAVPGVDSQKCTARPDRVRVIEGTSDHACDVKLQNTALRFARTYNLAIKAQLDAKRIKYDVCAL